MSSWGGRLEGKAMREENRPGEGHARTTDGRPPSLAFVFCVEPGRLEPEACLLARSIRHFAGRVADAPLYAVQPRGTDPLRPETLAVFDSAGVIHRAAKLNGAYAPWPTTNKVYA